MKDYRDRARGLADLLNYGFMVEEGIMLLKDGSFCAGWCYVGPDMHSVQDNELHSLRLTINQAFNSLGNGWLLHCDMIRSQTNAYHSSKMDHFPDAISLFIDNERRHFFQKENTHYVTRTYFVLTYKPPIEVDSKIKRFFVEGNSQLDKNCEDILKLFKNKIEQIEGSLSKSLTIKRLLTNELLSHLHTCITGQDLPIRLPQFFVYLDQFLASQDFMGGFSPTIGGKHIAVLSVNGYPLESYPNMLQHLTELPISFRWSNRFIFLDQITAIQELKKYRRYWFQKRQGLMGFVKDMLNSESAEFTDLHALEMAEDSDSALQEAESNLISHGFYTSVFVLTEEDESKLNSATKLITKELEKKGFSSRRETINAVEAYLGSLPGHGVQNVRKPLVSTLNLADFLPLLSLWNGFEHHPSPYYPEKSPPLFYAQTKGKTPFRCSLHVGDVGHTLILGDTGSGKSTLLGFLMAQHLRYKDAQVFMFDKGYSSFTLCHALNGCHYDIGKGQINLAPLENIIVESELDWACEWLETIYLSQGLNLKPLQRKEVRNSLQRLSRQSSRTLTDLQVSLQDAELKAALEFYTLSGAMGNLLDAAQDEISISHLQVFEMGALLNKEEKFVLPLLSYLFHQIDKCLNVNKPTLIIIEEGHHFLKGHFGRKLESWLRECRKQNAAVIFVTQGLSEIIQSPFKHILLNSCLTKIFLPNINATSAYNKELYYQLGLSEFEIDLIQQAIPKQDYYLTSPNGNKLMNLALSKSFTAFMAANNDELRQEILVLKEKHKDEWVYEYLMSRNLKKEAELWKQSNKEK